MNSLFTIYPINNSIIMYDCSSNVLSVYCDLLVLYLALLSLCCTLLHCSYLLVVSSYSGYNLVY